MNGGQVTLTLSQDDARKISLCLRENQDYCRRFNGTSKEQVYRNLDVILEKARLQIAAQL